MRFAIKVMKNYIALIFFFICDNINAITKDFC